MFRVIAFSLAVSVSAFANTSPEVECAQCREICKTRMYPGDASPDLRSGGLAHKSELAKSAFEEGVKSDPGLGGNNAKAAVEAYKRAVLIDPDNAQYRNHLAAALLTTTNTKEAIYNLERAIALAPTEPKYVVNLGYAWHRGGDEQRALVNYLRALVLDPHDLRAHLFAGYAMEILGMQEEAAYEFRRVLLGDPGHQGAKKSLKRLGKNEPPIGDSPPAPLE